MSTGSLPWRAGRSVGRTVYDADENLIGVMDTPELAARVVAAVNGAGATDATQALTAALDELNATRWNPVGGWAEWQRDTVDGRTFAHVTKAIEIIRKAFAGKDSA